MTQSTREQWPVAIIGGGPVGLSCALELAHHGIAAVVVEPRTTVDHARPRAKTVSARSMELLARFGAAAEIRRRAALPVEWSSTIRFCTTAAGTEIARLTEVLGLTLSDTGVAAEAGQQVTQPVVEEGLRQLIADTPLITLLTGWEATAVEVNETGARVQIRRCGDATGSHARMVGADYLVGADGARSIVRQSIDARYIGEAGGRPNVNITFRSRQLDGLVPDALHHWVLNPAAPGVVGPIDREGTWFCIATGREQLSSEPEAVDCVRALVGAEIDVDVIAIDPWQARMLLSDSYSSNRAFLVGDAAHQNPPWGGHGFNTGVGDAVNLGWKLAAVLNGWAPAELLDTYETDRRPIAERTIDLAARNMRSLSIELSEVYEQAEHGDAHAQAEAAAAVQEAKRSEFYSDGLVLGYGYTPNAMRQTPSDEEYLPLAEPGNRLPHQRSTAGESLYDLLGPELTLLGSPQCDWAAAAHQSGIPLTIIDPAGTGFPQPEGPDLVLVRPDQHIAWCGPRDSEPGPVLNAAVRGIFSDAAPHA